MDNERAIIEKAQGLVFDFVQKVRETLTDDEVKVLLSTIADKTQAIPDDIGYRSWGIKDLRQPTEVIEVEEDDPEYNDYEDYKPKDILEEVLLDQISCLWFSGEDLWR